MRPATSWGMRLFLAAMNSPRPTPLINMDRKSQVGSETRSPGSRLAAWLLHVQRFRSSKGKSWSLETCFLSHSQRLQAELHLPSW